ncbi:MAG: tRNA pseudouridine(55) synthase TruB, partial [Candidatus Omnitrophota bacterium]
MEDPFGLLIVDKAKGMTSHDVVDLVRRKFRIKKVGHAGTLDPGATGVLVLLVGKATKLSGDFLNQDKEYVATMRLGEKTDTGDSAGKIIEAREIRVSEKEIKDVMEGFLGESYQVPPMVSAKKVNGKRLYKIARKGIEIERQPKKIFIKEIETISVELPCVKFRVICSKGTYIRQLAEDAGEKLGCGAHLTELERTRSG